MALVGILTSIDAAIYSLNDNFSRVGANSFSIYPKEGPRVKGGGRRSKDAEAIDFDEAMKFKEDYSYPSKVSVRVRGTSFAQVKYAGEETNPNVRVEGVDDYYMDNNGYDLKLGRNFSPAEITSGVNKAIIGKDLVDLLFNEEAERAMDQLIAIDNVKYRVIGVLASKGNTMNSREDQTILIPLLTARRYYGSPNDFYVITVATRGAEDIPAAEAAATGLMRKVRRLRIGDDNDFEFRKSDSLISIIKENTSMLRISAVGIGLITLMGAAIGLMNIMLVSVTERTKEIGITKALGATERNIMTQFLTEAVLICQVGGAVGIVLGILIGNIITLFLGGSFLIPWAWIFTGIVLCLIVGVVSGIYPAMKAAKLDPIESLRYE